MAVYRDLIYPKIVSALGNPKPIQEVRRRILPLAGGAVLEVGFGSGVNLAYYDPAKVTRLYALEPNEGMTRIAQLHPQRRAFDVQFLDLPGEQIPLADGSIDTVVDFDGPAWPHPVTTVCPIPARIGFCRPGGSEAWRRP